MLRTDLLTLAAADAVGSLPAPLRMHRVPPIAVPIRIAFVRIHIGEQIGNGDMFGTAVHAVAASRTGNGVQRAEHVAHAVDRLHLLLRERFYVLHEGEIVVHLRHVAHARDDHGDLREMRGEPQSVTRVTAAVQTVENFFRAVGQIDENAALDRLHDDNGFVVPDAHVVAGAALNGVIVVIGVVELNLHDLDFGIRRQDLVEHVGGIVERESDVADPALFFEFKRRLIRAAALKLLKILRVLRVHQIEIEVLHAAPRELIFKERTNILLSLKIGVRELIHQHETFARIARGETFAVGKFALARDVPVRRVEIVESFGEERVYHV